MCILPSQILGGECTRHNARLVNPTQVAYDFERLSGMVCHGCDLGWLHMVLVIIPSLQFVQLNVEKDRRRWFRQVTRGNGSIIMPKLMHYPNVHFVHAKLQTSHLNQLLRLQWMTLIAPQPAWLYDLIPSPALLSHPLPWDSIFALDSYANFTLDFPSCWHA